MYQCINCNLTFVSESLYEIHNSTVQHIEVMKNLRTNNAKIAIQASSDSTCSDVLNDTGATIASTSSMHQPKSNSGLFFLKQRNIEEEPSDLVANEDDVLSFDDGTSKGFESD